MCSPHAHRTPIFLDINVRFKWLAWSDPVQAKDNSREFLLFQDLTLSPPPSYPLALNPVIELQIQS